MKKEEAINRLKVHKEFMDPRGVKTKEALDMAIEALQTDVVRCKDCRFFSNDKHEECRYYIAHGIRRKPNDFCSYGERRKDGE